MYLNKVRCADGSFEFVGNEELEAAGEFMDKLKESAMCEVFSSANPNKTFKSVHERDEYDKAYCVIQAFGERANIMSNNAAAQGFLDGFIAEHRTTQQSIVRCFCDMLCMWAAGEEGMLVDGRNERAWDFARRVRALKPGFPLV